MAYRPTTPAAADDFVPRLRPLRSLDRIAAEARRPEGAALEREAILEQTADDPEQRDVRLHSLAERLAEAEARDAADRAAHERLSRPEGCA